MKAGLRIGRNAAGDLIHHSADGIDNFWDWFGRSRAMNAMGMPWLAYHGTIVEGRSGRGPAFDHFDASKLGSVTQSSDAKSGFWFTLSMDRAILAASDAKDAADRNDISTDVMKVYLRVENPYHAPNILCMSTSEVASLAKKCREQGYDGIIFDVGEGQGSDILVFDSKQIKSATHNSGRFSRDSDSLTDRAPARRLKP